MASIIDVAQRAGVSIATVSRVINQSGYVSATTREKVRAAITELDFSPNAIARNLLQRKTGTIAAFVQNLTNPFFSQLVDQLERQCRENGYHLMILNSQSHGSTDSNYLDVLSGARVDGLILIADDTLPDVITKELPIVSLDRHFSHTPCISSNNYDGGRIAALHLYNKGCRKVVFLGDDALSHEHLISEVSQRKHGFTDFFDSHEEVEVIVHEYPKGSAPTLVQNLIDKVVLDESIDGVFCISDYLAYQLLSTARRLRRDVPKSLKVVSYDGMDIPLPGLELLTSVVQPIPLLAKSLVNNLLARLNESDSIPHIIPVSLRQGQTT